ncbi:hypothetical protein SEA_PAULODIABOLI_325 [Microbacterium phage PauloDiaboli]|nr:hypothetical protein SEA_PAULODIABOLI_325 [Microbacterium phage PauloDiaboli]
MSAKATMSRREELRIRERAVCMVYLDTEDVASRSAVERKFIRRQAKRHYKLDHARQHPFVVEFRTDAWDDQYWMMSTKSFRSERSADRAAEKLRKVGLSAVVVDNPLYVG